MDRSLCSLKEQGVKTKMYRLFVELRPTDGV